MLELKICHIRISKIYTLPVISCSYVITHTPDNVHVEKYVGSTINFHGRMYGHLRNILYVDLYVTDDINVLRSLEKILMELVRPATNKTITHLSCTDKLLMQELLENNIIEREYIFNNVMKIGCRYLKYVIRKKMSKKWVTLSVDEEIYKIVKDKQNELLQEKYGDKVELSYVTEEAILNGIDSVMSPTEKKIKENFQWND